MFQSLEEAWRSGAALGSCEAIKQGSEWTEQQNAAAAIAGYSDMSHLKYLYGICVMPGMGYATNPTIPYSESQVQEVNAALLICPTHPAADDVRAILAQVDADAKARADGSRFGEGVYLVGTEIQPGTFAIEGDITDCYWERQDANGNTIDNYFAAAAKRVQVTIAASDYAFSSTGCGTWVKID
ncbi:hypothetical protein GCM10027416_18700 [Okibacterium endophyticum]